MTRALAAAGADLLLEHEEEAGDDDEWSEADCQAVVDAFQTGLSS